MPFRDFNSNITTFWKGVYSRWANLPRVTRYLRFERKLGHSLPIWSMSYMLKMEAFLHFLIISLNWMLFRSLQLFWKESLSMRYFFIQSFFRWQTMLSMTNIADLMSYIHVHKISATCFHNLIPLICEVTFSILYFLLSDIHWFGSKKVEHASNKRHGISGLTRLQELSSLFNWESRLLVHSKALHYTIKTQ